MIRRAFQGIIDHYHEKLFVAYSNFPRLLKFLAEDIRLDGEDELQRALSLGRGVILVTGHYGAVEFLPGCLAVRVYPASMICRFQTNGLKDSLYERARAVNLNLIDAGEGNVFLAAVKALKSGQILITECDEFDEWRTDEHQSLNFLGCRLPGDKTLELLRKRSGAAVVTALVKRNGGRSYTLNLTGISNNGNGAQAPVGARCLQVLERAVLADPHQWYQWKKFGKMIYEEIEVSHARPEPGYLAPEAAVSLSLQA